MRVLRVMLLLAPLLAFAGWRQVGTVTPPLKDVLLVDAGTVLAVSLNSGAIVWQVTDAGVTTLNTLAGSFVGGGFTGGPNNCLLGLTGAGDLVVSDGGADAGCGVGFLIGPG